jgi:hypothetical protein
MWIAGYFRTKSDLIHRMTRISKLKITQYSALYSHFMERKLIWFDLEACTLFSSQTIFGDILGVHCIQYSTLMFILVARLANFTLNVTSKSACVAKVFNILLVKQNMPKVTHTTIYCWETCFMDDVAYWIDLQQISNSQKGFYPANFSDKCSICSRTIKF